MGNKKGRAFDPPFSLSLLSTSFCSFLLPQLFPVFSMFPYFFQAWLSLSGWRLVFSSSRSLPGCLCSGGSFCSLLFVVPCRGSGCRGCFFSLCSAGGWCTGLLVFDCKLSSFDRKIGR